MSAAKNGENCRAADWCGPLWNAISHCSQVQRDGNDAGTPEQANEERYCAVGWCSKCMLGLIDVGCCWCRKNWCHPSRAKRVERYCANLPSLPGEYMGGLCFCRFGEGVDGESVVVDRERCGHLYIGGEGGET
jgi:hypothetical protein